MIGDSPARERARHGRAANNRFLAALRAPASRPFLIAHRGDSANAPENTLEAARRGFEAGADAWEFDVQLTRDGVAVVIHDESLRRTTDVAQRFSSDPRARSDYLVADFDFEEIQTLDAGSWFVGANPSPRFASGEVRAPTLRACLELTAELDWLANVELKSFPNPDPRLFDRVASEIESVGIADRILISSFDHRDVAVAVAAGTGWATGVLTETPLFQPERYVRDLVGADCLHTSTLSLGAASSVYLRRPGAETLRTDDLAALSATGVPVLVFTVNDPRPDGLAAHLARAGVAALFTDRPGELRRLFEDRGGDGLV